MGSVTMDGVMTAAEVGVAVLEFVVKIVQILA